ncbi:hypothetical protein [Pseudofrankia inefficax]|nr:hypothetical protein [Pseudofrankia inefficax]
MSGWAGGKNGWERAWLAAQPASAPLLVARRHIDQGRVSSALCTG